MLANFLHMDFIVTVTLFAVVILALRPWRKEDQS